ncbi:glycosyltransferase [Glycomyces sp. TRM65418]|uniref:glycosyltransferase n=1 Tax=Glycomyces sp. TRM65418 TaxID=2867006 RepID=UPI001CE4C303|nr:glycosyltransferase [Glycomyces sp. TRM65418]MCC3762751.1 glycosyltransferase [Glycomyces sp. TRM65418]QZD56782.1 glycosyltransferase [Glycomyces sp. TRM65418]
MIAADETARYPARLTDDLLVRAGERAPGTLAATALRTRSPGARHLLARAACRSLDLPGLLEAARRGDAGGAQVNTSALCTLARVVGLQFGTEEDRRDALALYDLALRLGGARRVGARDTAVHAQLAYVLGDVPKTRSLLRRYGKRLPALERGALLADLAHPDRGGDEAAWIKRLGRLCGHPELRLAPAADGLPWFDRLRAAPGPTIEAGPRISVVMTAYRPDRALLTAVRSLIEGTWANLEVLVVDDASGAAYDEVLDAAAAIDDRVRVLRRDVNGGTFAARNTAFDAATGEYLTGLDADDWAAPDRLARAVAPLLERPELQLTCGEAFLFNEDLTATRPGRVLTTTSTASMTFRRSALDRIGYYDEVRKGADTEFLHRVAAAFGDDAVLRLRGVRDTLMRQAPGSLSREEFGPGWKHPARRAYQSSYPLWHRQIRDGADPYLPKAPLRRPFWAPQHTALARAEQRQRRFDVVFCLDWRPFGGPQKSTIEEIKALRAEGMAVAVMHLESWRHMTVEDRPMCEPVQRMVNDGVVEQVLVTDDVVCDLLVLRYPPILQFRSGERSSVRPRRMIVLANQAPHERDGSDNRYVPDACHANATDMFGVAPLWVPQGPQVREALAGLTAGPLADFDMPGILDTADIAPARTGFRSVMPVVGRHSRDDWTKWPTREDLPLVYPGDGRWDVRIMGGARSVAHITGEDPPVAWTCYGFNETDVESFLYQLDFWIYFPHPQQYEAFGRAVLEALAAGCVTILPPRFEATFGDAALYCEPAEVVDLVEAHYADLDRFLARSALAQQRVRERFSHDSYRKLVSDLLADSLAGKVAPD